MLRCDATDERAGLDKRSGDLHAATLIAMYMEGYWGMGPNIGSHAAIKGDGGQPIVDGTSRNLLESALDVL